MTDETKTRKARVHFDLEYKQRIVAEYLSGTASVNELTEREGLLAGQIYKWRAQLDERARSERLNQIQDENPEVTLEQAKRIRELEEELALTQKKMAQLAVENELLGELVKKTSPNSQYAKKPSGFSEIKAELVRQKGRVKS